MNGIELLPCPFCGGEAKLRTMQISEDEESAYVKCLGCEATTDIFEDAYAPTADAIAAWNKRDKGAKVPDGKFKRGDAVQRCSMPDGRPPAYRFPGFVCGEYDGGYVVSREGDLGCKQIFPAHMLELRTALGDKT